MFLTTRRQVAIGERVPLDLIRRRVGVGRGGGGGDDALMPESVSVSQLHSIRSENKKVYLFILFMS